MKIIIAGTRTFNDYEFLKQKVDIILSKQVDVEIVSGCAQGADLLGERYGKERGITVKRFPAEWNLYGKKAGYLRNEKMANYADALILFWDGESKGSKSMMD